MIKYEGIFPAIVTPLNENETLNKKALELLIEKTLKQGVSGFYVGGSTGESYLLSDELRVELIRTVCEITDKRGYVIANIGAFSTEASIKIAQKAAEAGVSAISAVPPFYFPYNKDEIKQYYFDIQKACGLPMIVYNVPKLSGISFSTKELLELLEHDEIIGIKQTTYDLYQTETLIRHFKEKNIFCGHDEIFLSATAVGVEAAIGSTFSIMGDKFIEIRTAYRNGELEKAKEIQGKVNAVIDVLLEIGIFKAIKGVLKLQGIDCGNCMRPFKPLTRTDYEMLENAMVKLEA